MSNFPVVIDTLVDPDNTKLMNEPGYKQTEIIGALNDAVTALETKVGINNSDDTTSLDYKTSRQTTKGDLLVHNGMDLVRLPAGTDGYMLVPDSTQPLGLKYTPPTSGGTVTGMTFTNGNGVNGVVTDPTVNPALALSFPNLGIQKSNGTALSTAIPGTDYLTPTTALPPGCTVDYAGSTAPSGWFLCDGSQVSRTTYSALFAVTGISYGAGNGTTTFNLPDCRGRVSVGVDGGTFAGLGSTGGEQTHTLTVGEMPAHNHGLATGTSGGTLYSHLDSSNSDGSGTWNANTNVDAGNYATVTLVNGSGTAHNNIQPYVTFNKIIKY